MRAFVADARVKPPHSVATRPGMRVRSVKGVPGAVETSVSPLGTWTYTENSPWRDRGSVPAAHSSCKRLRTAPPGVPPPASAHAASAAQSAATSPAAPSSQAAHMASCGMAPLVRKRRATLGDPMEAPHPPPWRVPARLPAPDGARPEHVRPPAASPSSVPSPQSRAARCQAGVCGGQEGGQEEEGGRREAVVVVTAAAWERRERE